MSGASLASKRAAFDKQGRPPIYLGEDSPSRTSPGRQPGRCVTDETRKAEHMRPVVVTDNAARRIAEIVASEPATPLFRVSVEGGGCSGFQYKFDLVGEAQADDIVLENGAAKVLIDPVSIQYMEGAEIDFVDDLIGQSFKIRNPQATASCGCGTSFSL